MNLLKLDGWWQLLQRRTVLVLAVLAVGGGMLVLWHVSRVSRDLVETTARQDAALYSEAIAEFRTLYTSEVVGAARKHGLKVSHDYDKEQAAIPLPATLSMLLGQKIGAKQSGAQTHLYSPYPFPWRKETGGLRDPFAEAAWAHLKEKPDAPFYRFEQIQGRSVIRYATADRLRQACVNCHNTHADSPKTDWQEGDVRGILEIVLPLDRVQASLGSTLLLIGGILVAGLSVLWLVIDRLKRTTAEAQRLAQDALQASRAKSAFLATMRHEIRTPLNAVLGMASLLQDTELTAQQREFTRAIRTGGHTLLEVISEVLDFSSLEAGRLELEREPLNLRACVESALDAVAARGAEKGLEMTCQVAPDAPAWIIGDAARLRQVLIHLIDNAVKFTAQGQVVVLVSSSPATDGRHALTFQVRDTGIGIAPAQMPQLFQSFSQVDPSSTRKYGGAGLGLVIAKRLVELMGGRMEVSSEPGKGSTFQFTLVAAGVPAPVSDLVNRRDAAPVTLAAGATAGATAPSSGGAKSSEFDSTLAMRAPLDILVAEDVPLNQQLVRVILARMGYTADFAGNGREALHALERRSYDLVLMDLQMPEMDGLECTREIVRRYAAERRPAIVALTANASIEDARTCREAGMDDFLTKPIKGLELRDVLERWSQKRRQPAPGGVMIADRSPRQPVSQADEVELIDDAVLSDLRDLEQGEAGLLQSFIDAFRQAFPEHVALMRQALAAGDAEQLRKVAHRLKGTAANVAAQGIAAQCQALEKLARAGQLADVAGTICDLEQCYERTNALFAEMRVCQ